MRETKDTSRYRNPTKPSVRGKLVAKRWNNVDSTGKTWTPNPKFNFAVFQNSGATDCRLNFNYDSDYWTIKAGAQTPVLMLNDTVTVNMKTASGTTTIEAIAWG